ncbi:prenyltransferase [Micromonospora sp. SH-82]|uniref:prenyltransferase n=1 Tax=Micromonospora sp. SH-82 TaxID=3132938 RepID=UPI003EBFB8AF
MNSGELAEIVRIDVDSEVRDLVARMVRHPAGQVSASTYETARLVSLAPWLTGHDRRVRHLVATQRADGGWGTDDPYGLVPTASATEALLTVVRTGSAPGLDTVIRAASRAVTALADRLGDVRALPDTPAIDLIVPALVGAINEHLADPPPGLPRTRLPLPPGMTGARLAAVRDRVAAGTPLHPKLHHAVEVVADLLRDLPGLTPLPSGTVGASPAATAAWLAARDRPDAHPAALSYLEGAVRPLGGLAPCTTPIAVFERAWVLSTLTRAGLPVTVPAEVVRSLTADLGPAGVATSPGLPPDADTTAVTLYALMRLGVPVDPDCLWPYETGAGFCTWPGEDGLSVTTNAHVLDALGRHLADGAGHDRHHSAVDRLQLLLLDRQDTDGAWRDRWHASPYYATLCCALALHSYGRPATVAPALTRAARWVVDTQRADGSWGRSDGTAEETAYALHLLCTVASGPDTAAAVARGHAYLIGVDDGEEGLPLWHDKDLYRPDLIVRAAVLVARHLAAPA